MPVRDPKATTFPMNPNHARKERRCETITPRKTCSNGPKSWQECILEMTPITDNSATDPILASITIDLSVTSETDWQHGFRLYQAYDREPDTA